MAKKAPVRDAKGRFSKTAGQKVSATKYLKLGKAIRRLVDDVEEQKAIQEARRQIKDSISKAQRKRLLAFIGTQKIKETHGTKEEIKKELDMAVASTTSTTAKAKKKTGSRRKIALKDGQLEVGTVPTHESFKVYDDLNHNYTVEKKGEAISLNRYKRVMEYLGDPVKGMPPILKNYKTATEDKLFGALALAQSGQRAGNALKVNLEEHDMESSHVSDKGYGVFQIHHKDQWSKNPPIQIEADYKAGKIDDDQRKALYAENLRPKPGKTPPYKQNDFEIIPRKVGDREFVLLPGGLHECQTPLFLANHPKMIRPGTDKWDSPGIPDRDKVPGAKDDGESRQWFEARFRTQFWKQYFAHEAKTIRDEINARLKSGTLSEEDAKKLLDKYKLM